MSELTDEQKQKLKDEISSYISWRDPYDAIVELTEAIINGEIEGITYEPK